MTPLCKNEFKAFFLLIVLSTATFMSACISKKPIPPQGTSSPISIEEVIPIAGVDAASLYRRLENGGFNPGTYNEKDPIQLSEAVRAFQIFAHIEDTGILDEATWDKLKLLYDPSDSENSPVTTSEGDILIGDAVFAVEKIECSDISGNWIIFYEGIVTDKNEETLSVRLERRLSYRYRPNKEGSDDTDWYCIPAKKHCYSAVKFSDWGGKLSENEVADFPVVQICRTDKGIITCMSFFLKRKCKR